MGEWVRFCSFLEQLYATGIGCTALALGESMVPPLNTGPHRPALRLTQRPRAAPPGLVDEEDTARFMFRPIPNLYSTVPPNPQFVLPRRSPRCPAWV